MIRPRPLVRRLSLVVAMPLLLVAIGVWQYGRADGDIGQYRDVAAAVDAEADRLAPEAARTPFATLEIGGKTYGLAYGLTRLRDAAGRQRTNADISAARRDISVLTALGGVLALVAGGIGLIAAARVGAHIRTSRAELVARFTLIRRLLPRLLMVQVASLLLAIICGIVFEVAALWDTSLVATVAIRVGTIALAVVGALAWLGWVTVRRLRRALAEFVPEPNGRMGHELTAAEAPGLFVLIAAIVARQRSLAPDHVVAGLIDGFFVTMAAQNLLPSNRVIRGRTLYLPISQMAMLGRGEITSVLAHELAHFAGEDTDYSQRFLPIYHRIGHSLSAVRDGSNPVASRMLLPASTLGLHMMEVFAGAVSHWSRLRELAADAAAVVPGEPLAIDTALIRTGLIAPVVDAVMAQTWAHPRSASTDLVTDMLARAKTSGFGNGADRLEERQPHPTDSHPPTRQRIEALGASIDAALLTRAARPVSAEEGAATADLFADWNGLCAALSADAVAIATEHDDAVVAQLVRTAALPTPGALPILEDLRPAYISYGLTAAFGLGIGGFLIYAAACWTLARPDALGEVVSAGAGLLLLGAVAVFMLIRRLRSRSLPFLILDARGFTCRYLDRRIAWEDVARVSAVAGRATVTIVWLEADVPLPVRVAGHRVRIGPRRHTVALNGIRPRGMTVQAYYNLIVGYLSAARASAALAARQGEFDAAGTDGDRSTPMIATECHADSTTEREGDLGLRARPVGGGVTARAAHPPQRRRPPRPR